MVKVSKNCNKSHNYGNTTQLLQQKIRKLQRNIICGIMGDILRPNLKKVAITPIYCNKISVVAMLSVVIG
jgi:kynureninase